MLNTSTIKLFLAALLLNCLDTSAQSALYIGGTNGLYIEQNLTVQAEGNVSIGPSGVIAFENGGNPDFRLKGNFTNDATGVYTLGTEKIRFNGTALQNADFGGDNVYGIYTDNASHVQITSHVTLTGVLEFGTGNVQSTDAAHITLGTGATVATPTSAKHNNGPIAKKFDATANFALPTGNGTSYMPLSFQPDGTGATTMKAEYVYSAPSSRTSLGTGLNRVSGAEYWNLSRSSGTENGAVTLSWNSSSGVANTFETDLVVAYWNGTEWTNGSGNSHTGDFTSGTVKSNSISSFSRVVIGSTTSNNPLPIELLSFDAKLQGKIVKVSWQTATEKNNDYFVIERSNNANSWETIDTLNGTGVSLTTLNYLYLDENPLLGTSYYRLKQVDFDKSFSYSEIAVVNYEGIAIVNLFPNPSEGNFNIVIKSSLNTSVELTIYNAIGQVVKSKNIVVTKGLNPIQTQFEGANGKYFITVKTSDGEYYDYSVVLNR